MQVCVHSKWGRNRVAEQQATQSPINLVLPVLTRPDVVEQAVAGILSGQIGLTWFSVEPLLVLANAVGVSHMASVLCLRDVMFKHGVLTCSGTFTYVIV